MSKADTVLIAGPTASGKSALALKLADERDGVIINADSMQVYELLRIVTARPDERELAMAEHRLYGHVAVSDAYSTALWLKEAEAEIAKCHAAGKTAIIVGGTGLYFKALEEGLSHIPDPDPGVRSFWREFGRTRSGDLHGELSKRDVEMARLLRPSDTQRLVRALEVFDTTEKSIFYWQQQGRQPSLVGPDAERLLVEPERSVLHHRIDLRLDAMIEEGALEEVRALMTLDLPLTLPAMKAIGVPQLADHLAGKTSLEVAVSAAKAATRQYAKRQSTWFRNQLDASWYRV
ncbi:MAG: tRNA (adenosine(37)-N6)-dimethylallyltransferase MiaA [Rhizobiaceae bacterium]